MGDKLTDEQKSSIQKSSDELKEILKTGSISDINVKIENLRKIVQEAGTSVYQKAAAQQTQRQAKTGNTDQDTKSDKKVVDAEYKVVDEEK